jgi:hypothetical protein
VTSLPSTMRHGKDALLSDYGKVAGLLTTASVPAAQRLEFWREVVCHTIAGVEADALVDEQPYSGAIHAQPIPLAICRASILFTSKLTRSGSAAPAN